MVFDPDFLDDDSEQHPNQLLNDRFGENPNQLLKYLQHQSPEVLARVAQAVSPEIKQIISQNVQGLVGVIPTEHFNVQITPKFHQYFQIEELPQILTTPEKEQQPEVELEKTIKN